MLSPSTPFAAPPRLDVENQCLWRGDQRILLTPKSFRVLHYLFEHRGQLVTKEALLQSVWPRTAVEASQVKQFVAELRKLLRDDVGAPRYIETVRGRGYRFIGHLDLTAHQRMLSPAQARTSTAEATPVQNATSSLLVGREGEIRLLRSRYDEVLRGTACACLVTGESGVGKSALITAFIEQIGAARSAWILRGQCVESLQRVEPLLPVLSALEGLCDGPDASLVVSEMRRIAPLWLRQIPGLIDGAELENLRQQCEDASQARKMREFCRLMDSLASHRPVIIWLEDLHWADESTLHLIAHLVSQSQLRHVLFVGTSLPIESLPPDHLLRRLPSILRVRLPEFELPLSGLSRASIRKYLDLRWPDRTEDAHPDGGLRHEILADRLLLRSEGHPLFMVKLAEHYSDLDINTASGHEAGSRIEENIPRSLQPYIEGQLALLEHKIVRLLEVAAVAGSEFSSALVAAVLDVDTDLVESQLEQLARGKALLMRRGVREWPDGTIAGAYGFVHRIYRQSLLTRIPGHRHARLHQLLGERLERAYGEHCEEVAIELSHHFRQSRDVARMSRYETMMKPQTGVRHIAPGSVGPPALVQGLGTPTLWQERGTDSEIDGM